VPDAENAGENTVDLTSSAAATPSPQGGGFGSAAQSLRKSRPRSLPAPKPAAEQTPGRPCAEARGRNAGGADTAPVDVAALPAETTPDPVAEAITEAAPAEPQFAALPSAGPVPQARPEPPREAAPKPAQETASSRRAISMPTRWQRCSTSRMPPAAVRRSTETAALGGTRTTRGNTLSQSEMDALRGQIQRYWNIIPGMADGGDVRVTVKNEA
jgi:hypothetical protein